MFSKMHCIYLRGIEGQEVTVEADVSDGLPGYNLVGYLASEVREGGDRVRTAIRNLNLKLPPKRITINLSPAGFRKEGTGFDLAIGAAVLAGYGCFPAGRLKNSVLLGELGLDGSMKGVSGALAIAAFAKERGYESLFLPEENVREASVIQGLRLIAVKSLRHFADMMTGKAPVAANQETCVRDLDKMNCYDVDFFFFFGQLLLRKAAETAAAGMHNMLMIGPAGTGKTMVARRMPTIMPAMDLEECIEISKIYSVSRLLSDQEPLILKRPFRNPHHTVSPQALAGGGGRPRPGEISLASGGILFLDELPEMGREALETLRQPLEERCVTITRLQGAVTYPANFQLVAAMNPCPCGHFPDRSRCSCTPAQIRKYLGRISGPLLDRIDICVEAAPVSYDEIRVNKGGESSASIRSRVERARKLQARRFRGLGIRCNAEMTGAMIRRFCVLDTESERLLEEVYQKKGMSARTYDRILKVARTIADLENEERIRCAHLYEALSFVSAKEQFWGRQE